MCRRLAPLALSFVHILMFFTVGTPSSFAQTERIDINQPRPRTPDEQRALRQVAYLEVERGTSSIFTGAAIGAAADVVWHVAASQLFSRSRWIRGHCADCRPQDLPQLVLAILRDLPGFAMTGAAIGACDASGTSANRMCLGAGSALIDGAIHAAVRLIHRDESGNFHFLDHIAGQSAIGILMDQIAPRGVVPFSGTCPDSQVGNAISEVGIEGVLLGTANYAAISMLSHLLHGENIRIGRELVDGIILGGIPSGLEHLTLVLTLGPRFRLSDAERNQILSYTQARIGVDNSLPLSRTDLRLSPAYVSEGGLLQGNVNGSAGAQTFGTTVVMNGSSMRDHNFFLAAIAHEVTHVRQFEILGAAGMLRLYLNNSGAHHDQQPLEVAPMLLDHP